ncbi:MAG: hypothetical protein KDB53_16930, partial [Planctomycetes bacterium]|nr:hypothetical protein [Planctomycetota bacterium]
EKGRIESARLIASKMDDLTLTVPMKSNDGGQLFGSVTEQIVAENLGKAIGVEIHPQQVILGSHFKRVGEYFAAIRLHSEVEIELPVHVVAEGGADEDETGMAKVMEAAESDEDLVDEAEETPVED